MTHDEPLAQIPARTVVTSFRPGGEDSFFSTAGGGAGPFLSFVIAATLLVGLSYWWVDIDALATPRDEPFRAAGGVVLLVLAFIAVLSLLSLVKALAGRRPWLVGRLRLAPDRILVGGTLRGELELSTPVRQEESVVIVLTCTAFDVGAGDSSANRFRWGTEQVVDGAACLQGSPTKVPFEIPIPPDAPPSGTYQMGIHRCHVTWYVRASIEPRASAFQFVVKVDASSPPTSILDGLPPEFASASVTPVRPACSRILKTAPAAGGVEYRLPQPAGWTSAVWWVALDRLSAGPVRIATFVSVAEARWLAADITQAIAAAKAVRDRRSQVT
jgi:hypothetical protein